MVAFDQNLKIRVKQQIVQIGVALVGIEDRIEKLRPDDAAAAPYLADLTEWQLPLVAGAGRPEHGKTLSVSTDFCEQQRPRQRFGNALIDAADRFYVDQSFGDDTFFFDRR